MPGKPSKAAQQTAIGQGLAVGCLMLGHTNLPSQKTNIEFAFRKAWRDWPHAGQFPQVRSSVERDDIMRILHDSAGRRRPIVAYWEVRRSLQPVLASGFDLEDASDLLVSFYSLPIDAWQQLARAFTDDLLRD